MERGLERGGLASPGYRPSRTPPLCTCEANLFLEVQSEDRIITTVQLYTWALMMALMLAGFLCSPDLSSRCEEANFQAVQCEGSAFLRRDRNGLGRVLLGQGEEMPHCRQTLAICHGLRVG